MAENSATSTTILENGIPEEQKNNIKNGDVHVPETHPLENGDIKKIPEEPSTSAAEVTTSSIAENTTNVAEQKVETKIADDKVGDGVAVKNDTEMIKEDIQITHTFAEKENESKINDEVEEGNNEITRSFEFVHVNKKIAELNESKNDEIITLQEVTILPFEEEQNRVSKKPKEMSKLVGWDTKKTVFFFFFLFAFVVWIVAYYAFDTGLIPNDKPSKK